MTLLLADPRKFSQIYPDSNILINQALHDKAQNDTPELMQALISDILKQGNNQLLSVAYNLAPNLDIANYLWDNLQLVINNPQEIKTNYWMIPVVIVAGSAQQVNINTNIDANTILKILLDKQVIHNLEDYAIMGQLYPANHLLKLTPAQIYHLQRDEFGHNNLPPLLEQSLSNLGENVHLLFIVCSTRNNLRLANFEQASMPIMKYLNESLSTDDSTLFPIPFTPCRLSNATLVGESYRKEIAITLALSNQLKSLRLNGKQPFVKLSTQENNIKIELMTDDTAIAHTTLIWNLQPVDDFTKITQILENLFIDMQLDINYKENTHE